jgi:isochorismate synthase
VTTTVPGGRLAFATEAAPDLDPIALFTAAREDDLEAALWLQPAAGFALVGIGRAWSVEPEGPGRFEASANAWHDVVTGAAGGAAGDAEGGSRPDLPPGAGPVLLGGLGFTGRRPVPGSAWEPFGAASLVLPETSYVRTAGGAWRTTAAATRDLERRWDGLVARATALAPAAGAVVARPVDAPLTVTAEQPDHGTWDRLVGLFAGAVGRGRLDKVVLARRVDLRSPLELDIPNALRRLAATAPESAIFAFVRDGRTFLGATPERLVRTHDGVFETVAIAGSAPRGATREADEALAVALLANDKEREEHAVVVEMLRDSLTPLAERLEVAPGPAILPLRTVQHLVTPIRGVLRDGPGSASAGLLGLAALLHPTPAVGGEPRGPALEMIAEHEGWDRGWYAGPVGWLGADGDGEFMVALRSGIVAGQAATLFAGCGIMADSSPSAEWGESRLKLRALSSALGREAETEATR